MYKRPELFLFPFILSVCVSGEESVKLLSDHNEHQMLEPAIFLPIIARNVEYSLPNWLGYLENFDYPKKRIFLWIRSDHNEDNTAALLHSWVEKVRHLYHGIDINTTNIAKSFEDEKSSNHWSKLRLHNIIKLRQEALNEARRRWADYIFFLDCDIFITNSFTLWSLIGQKKTILAPMILSFTKNVAYSNFWCGKDDQGYYKRTDAYLPILGREEKGCFEVVMVHSAVLIDLRRAATAKLYYDPINSSFTKAPDDVMIFAHAVNEAGLKFHVLNKDEYGYLIEPRPVRSTLRDSEMKFQHIKLEWLIDEKEMPVSSYIPVKYPIPDKAGFNEVFVINLLRRPDRREKMKESLKLLGIDGNFVEAFDGKRALDEEIENMGIKVLPGYADPYHGRPVTKGEIGCFMSHFLLWERMVREGLEVVLFLEDDIRFEPDFRRKLDEVMQEANQYEWDFMYVGRKLTNVDGEDTEIPGAKLVIKPGYSWWTLGYVLTLEGAKKLLAPKPLERFIPVDEYIPIMFDQHPNKTWSNQFEVRNLNALSASPYLLYPTHYIGDDGYFSDTETLTFVPKKDKTQHPPEKVEL